jgi:hypothetical protein
MRLSRKRSTWPARPHAGSGCVVVGAARSLIGDTDQRRRCQRAPTTSRSVLATASPAAANSPRPTASTVSPAGTRLRFRMVQYPQEDVLSFGTLSDPEPLRPQPALQQPTHQRRGRWHCGRDRPCHPLTRGPVARVGGQVIPRLRRLPRREDHRRRESPAATDDLTGQPRRRRGAR